MEEEAAQALAEGRAGKGPQTERGGHGPAWTSMYMHFAVLPLLDHRGRRRSWNARQREGHRVGCLRIEPVSPDEHEGRPSRRARLEVVHNAYLPVYFGDLFDPVVLAMDDQRMVLRGFTVHDDGYGLALVVQAWLVKPWPNTPYR